MAADPGPSRDPREHPYGSIIERYRGTEWDSTPPPPPKPPRQSRSGFLAFLLVAVAGLGVLGTVVLLNLPQAPPEEPSGPRPNPGVTARVPDSMRIIEAFWQTVRAKDLSYRLEGSGEGHGPGIDYTFTLSLTIRGDDYVGTVNTIGGSGMSDLVRLDGVVWVRPAGGTWTSTRTNSEVIRQDPFMGLKGRRELKYDAPVPGTDPVEHRLVSTEFYRPNVARMVDLAEFRLDADTRTLELIVDDAGVPLRATFTSHVDEDPTLNLPDWHGTATYTFTDFGIDAEIVAPTP